MSIEHRCKQQENRKILQQQENQDKTHRETARDRMLENPQAEFAR